MTVTPSPFSIRTAEEAFASVPLICGFQPSAAVMVFAFDGVRPVHVRVDMPVDEGSLVEATVALTEPLRSRHVTRGLLLILEPSTELATIVGERLRGAFEASGVRMEHVLHSNGINYREVGQDDWHEHGDDLNPLTRGAA